MAEWESLSFEDVLSDESGGNLKTQQTELRTEGRYPVIDQGKELIAGYVDDAARLCRAPLPVIVFGDHTRNFKYVDFPFCMGADGTKILRPRGHADVKYLYHYLRRLPITNGGYDRHYKYLKRFDVALPPIDEQRRIADILDRAEALRTKRRAALAQLDTLTQSIFLDLFGDPVTNPRGWPTLALAQVLAMPLRNGLSPSHAGTVNAKVLTLSAITGDRFNDQAMKTSTFLVPPPADQSVSIDDFLICRGNGNVRLVGRGYFPHQSMADVTFPDTMIAARVAPAKIERAFLQHVWNSTAVRRQVEALARTTNGTFKVNQTVLEGINFVAPPLALQQTFARRAAAVEKLKSTQRASLAELDALFASLQHRAFRGEL